MGLFETLPFRHRARPDVQPPPLQSTLGTQPVPLLGPLTNYFPLTPSLSSPTEGTIFGLPGANRCLQLISNATAQMLTHGKVVGDNDGAPLAKPLICDRPNVYYGSYEFWQEAVAAAVIHGNYVALIAEVDVDGYPLQVAPIHPASVHLDIENGQPVYEIGERTYSWRQVVHVRGLTLPGNRWGIGVLESNRRGLVAAYDQQTFAIKSVENGGSPNLIISLDTPHAPVQEEIDRIKSQWTSTYTRGNREPAVLPKTMNVQPVQWSPEDMEFLESRRFTIAELAFMFNLDPTDLSASVGGQGTLNYQNGSSREVVRLLHSYGPWLHRFEDAWSDLLPPGQRFQGNVEAVMRMSPQERAEFHKSAIEAGWRTVPEVREIEGLPPLTQDTTNNEE